MRLSIRNQILIPVIAIQGVAVVAVTLTTATLAARRSERQVIERLNGVVETLGRANFPYTASTLSGMHGLSGAHFLAYSGEGPVVASSFSKLEDRPPAIRAIPGASRLESLGDSPTVTLDAVPYFAVLLRSTAGPRGGTSLLVLYPETSWRQANREAATPPLVLGGSALVLMVAVASWVAQRISGRIRAMERQVARIAAGDFEGLDSGPRSDEIRDLAGSINSMCNQLNQMQTIIRRSEKTRLLAQLAAGLAHQLRNSITGARLSVQLHARRFPPREGDETLNVALRQLAMTEEQVKGLLSLGRVEPRPLESCDLGRIIAEVAVLVEPSCQHAKVTLRHHQGDAPISILADPSGVRAAALNLVLNAIEAAGPGGSVGLEILPDGQHAAIEISDNGPGPLPELAEAIGEAFVTSKAEGVGLGLALAHQVAADHGGRLSWSRRDGETRFRLEIPRATAGTKGAEWDAS